MHPLLANICLLTLHLIIDSEDTCFTLLQDLNLISTRGLLTFPRHHGMDMTTCSDSYKPGWRYRCAVCARNCSAKASDDDDDAIFLQQLGPLVNTILEKVILDVLDVSSWLWRSMSLALASQT